MNWSFSRETRNMSFFHSFIPGTQQVETLWNTELLPMSNSVSMGDLKEYFFPCLRPDSSSEDERERLLLEYISSEFTPQSSGDPGFSRDSDEAEVLQDLLGDHKSGSNDAIVGIENRRFLQEDIVSVLRSLDETKTNSSSQLACQDCSIDESSCADSNIPKIVPLFNGDNTSKEYIGKRPRGRPPKYQKWIDDFSETPFVLNNYKRRKPRKYRELKYSKFCHICNRNMRRVPLYYCANSEKGLCRKALCLFCIGDYRISVDDRKDGSKGFICTHCEGVCPERAQCKTYLKTNLRRRAQVLISRN
ncbi:hypothetical protein GpartN1_g7266.t1 [Galdieria partita]|uniref:Zinc-finger domain-containing protein n=1 Tax=Galdieria partita TaxID=83374 RepID=A0A9C7UUF2_9RHOD|nr:hypothetical protein GpartN1_g7266.t1 [Galdieria partita]